MSKLPRISRLWLSIAGPFLLFVAAGSMVLVLWMQVAAQRESRAVFLALARTNADFLRNAHLPATPQMMEYLGRLLNLHSYLRTNGTLIPPPTGQGGGDAAMALMQLRDTQGVTTLGRHLEAVAMPVQPGMDLILARNPEPTVLSVWRSETFLILGIFWLLSVGLAWAVARGVVQPIRLLAQRLPHIESDPAATLPGAERADELGELARAYLAAREQLGIEREKRQQAERMALLGRMATGLAHEIHNPLSAIRMHAQLLQSATGAEFKEMAEEFVPTLLEETGRIESLVNQWMFLTRPEPPACSALDIGELIGAAVRGQSGAAAHAGVTLERDATDGLLVMGDKRRLAQAITNAMVNAIQAMRGGGRLRISAAREGSLVAVTFQDTGPGFSQQALGRYRELFFSEKEGGMGIGLSVTAEILEAHHGRLEVRNGPGGGACVKFCLPADQPTNQP